MIPRIGRLTRAYRNLRRYQEIIRVLAKYGFGELLSKTHLYKLFRRTFSEKKVENIAELDRWQRMRMVLEELGPTFVKFGQIMSNRPDLLPPPLIDELEKLQSQVPPFPGEEAVAIIEANLGASISDIFDEFSVEPMASASIAQAHRGVLKTGEEVAVKVQRPGIGKTVEVDLEIMFDLAHIVARNVPEIEAMDPVSIVQEFAVTIRKEMDFNVEATHIERFATNFEGTDKLVVPEVYRDYSTKRVLFMEFIHGVKPTDLKAVRDMGCDPVKIAEIGTDLILRQIFEFGFFHGDPHPGNIKVLPNNTICFLDFGMMGNIYPKYIEYLADFIIGFVNKDAERVTKTLLSFSISDRGEIDTNEFELKIADLIDQIGYQALQDINVGEILTKSMDLVINYRLRLPPFVYLLTKSIVTIEGIARRLDDNFNMVKKVEPYTKRMLKQRLNPFKIMADSYVTLLDVIRVLREFPSEFSEITRQLKLGKIKVTLDQPGFQTLARRLDKLTTRLSYALIIAAFFIGASIVLAAQVPPLWYDISIIGLMGYIFVGSMFFLWFWSNRRNTRKSERNGY